MTRGGDCGLRIKQEIQTYFELGYRIGLLHLPEPGKGKQVSNDIHLCVRENWANVVAQGTPMHVQLAIVFSPDLLNGEFDFLSCIKADKVVMVQDRQPNPKQMGQWFKFAFGPMIWAPTNRWIRAKLESFNMPVQLSEMDWRPIARAIETKRHPAVISVAPVIGRVSVAGEAQWPAEVESLLAIYPTDPSIDFRVVGPPPAKQLKNTPQTNSWTIVDPAKISIERFVEMLDVFMYFPGSDVPELPDAAIACAMASGKIVVLPEYLRPHIGDGAVYAEPHQALAAIFDLFDDDDALKAAREKAIHHSGFRFSRKLHEERLRALVPPKKRRASKRRPSKNKRALFVPSNGIGLGHVSRLLAIARRMPDSVDPIFASMSQAAGIIESFGFASEYFPSHREIGISFEDWDDWFQYELSRKIDQFDVDLVVFDGNNPSPGLVEAVQAHGRCRLNWVRRGMGGEMPSPYLENSKYFDLIIEPGEVAHSVDNGPTSMRRDEVLMVDPITLLDRNELLSAEEAKAHLGLNPDAPAVLLQMGGGANRDVLALCDSIIENLKPFPSLQIVMAEWGNGLYSLPLWPNTSILRGFPISRYFNAFNFSIAAAGYNSYHEVIGFGLPTIFMPNRDPSMDDQGGRADFAQDHGAGFVLPEDQLFHLGALCEALLNDQAREVVHQNCLNLSRPNGAGDAARAIMEICG